MAMYSQNIAAIRKKVRRVHKKARLVGWLYQLGAIIAVALAFFPCLKIQYINGDNLSIANFFKPFLWIFRGDFSGVFVFLLYLVLIISCLIYFFRICSFFRRVLKKNDKNVNACNRNVSAMEDMGVAFGHLIFTIFLIDVLMFVVTPSVGKIMVDRTQMPITLWGYVFIAVAMLIRFLAGGIGATSSLFIVGVSVEEKKRTDNVWVYVIRSLIKVLVVFGLMVLVLPVCTIYDAIPNILKFNFDALMPNGDVMPLLGVVLQLAAIVLIGFALKHALSPLEFNLFGMDAYGIRKFAIYSLISGIICIGAFVVDKNWKADPPTMIYNYLIAGVVGVIGFVIDFIVKPRDGEKPAKEVVRDWKDVKESKKQKVEVEEQQPVQIQQQPAAFPTSIDLHLTLPEPPEHKVGDLPTKWAVKCPTCGKDLMVKEAPYHRCPACGKVFCLNLGKVESAATQTLEEASAPVVEEKAKKKFKLPFRKK